MPGSQPPEPTQAQVEQPLPQAALADLLALFLFRRRHMRVDGFSMAPTLLPGDLVLITPMQAEATLPALGSIVVARHPGRSSTRIIKRLAEIQAGRLVLLGDNPGASTDSRQFGAVPRQLLIGVVTSVVR
jgi:nickel-type superoxide dismutase maturation protease